MGYTRSVLQGLTPYTIYLESSEELSNGDVKHYFKVGRYRGKPPVIVPITISASVMEHLEIPTPKTNPEIWSKGVDEYNRFAEEKRVERADILWGIVEMIDQHYQDFVRKSK